MNIVLSWVRTNVFTVIFVAVMIAAVVGLPVLAMRWNAAIRRDVESRLDNLIALESLEKTDVSIGSVSRKTIVNPQLLARYRAVTETARADAEKVRHEAALHNEKDHAPIMEGVFPDAPVHARETIPGRFHGALVAAYAKLLERVKAGMPPDLESMREEIERAQANFFAVELQREPGALLEAEEAVRLRESLAGTRRNRYLAAAEEIRMYASNQGLNVPSWDHTQAHPWSELYEWQWQFWICSDILLAFDDANAKAMSVIDAPFKRLIDLYVLPESDPAAGGGGAGGGAGGFGAIGGGAPGKPSGAPPAAPADPGREIAPDYNVSLTGRATNALYDVRYVELRIVVDTARMLEVLDAISRRNFMTVLDLDLVPVDSYAAMAEGFLYGGEPVSELRLLVETVWLREWTSRYMPQELKIAKGVPVAPAAPAAPAG